MVQGFFKEAVSMCTQQQTISVIGTAIATGFCLR
jgi:hypothetical protein